MHTSKLSTVSHSYVFTISALMLCTILSAYVIARFAFQFMPVTTDENSYIFQAYCFLDGILARPVPLFQEAFDYKMLIMKEQTGWVSRYAPGHALFLVPGLIMGNPHLLVAMSAGAIVVILADTARLVGDCSSGISAALLLVLSPFFLFHHGTLLSHASGMLAVALLLWGYILWRTRQRKLFAVLAGLAWAWLFTNRTYTAVLLALPFAVDALIFLWRRRDRNTLLGTIGFAGGAFTGFVVVLFYNYLVIGNPLSMTYLFYNPTENLGFGMRYYGTVEHTWSRGIENMMANLRSLNIWLSGFWGSGFLWIGLAFFGWKPRWSLLCFSGIFMIIFGFIFFWYPGPEEAGPGYYLEALPFMVLVASLGLSRLMKGIKKYHIALLISCLVLLNLHFSVATGRALHENTQYRAELTKLFQDLPVQSLVVVNPKLIPDAFDLRGNDILFNPLGMESSILLARTIGPQDYTMLRYFQERNRNLYTISKNEIIEINLDAYPEKKYEIEYSGSDMHKITGENIVSINREVKRVAYEGKHLPGEIAFGRYFYVSPGKYNFNFSIKSEKCFSKLPVAKIDIAMNDGKNILQEKMVYQNDNTINFEIDFQDYTRVEPRVHFLGCGNILFDKVTATEIE